MLPTIQVDSTFYSP